MALAGAAGWTGFAPNFTIASHNLPSNLSGQANVFFRFWFGSDGSVNGDGFALNLINITFDPPITYPSCNSSSSSTSTVSLPAPNVVAPISNQVASVGYAYSLPFTSTTVFNDTSTATLSISANVSSWLTLSLLPQQLYSYSLPVSYQRMVM